MLSWFTASPIAAATVLGLSLSGMAGTVWLVLCALMLVGAVIESITQQPWHAQVRHMLQPLGLQRTEWDDAQRVIPGMASGYGQRRPAPDDAPRHRTEARGSDRG